MEPGNHKHSQAELKHLSHLFRVQSSRDVMGRSADNTHVADDEAHGDDEVHHDLLQGVDGDALAFAGHKHHEGREDHCQHGAADPANEAKELPKRRDADRNGRSKDHKNCPEAVNRGVRYLLAGGVPE